MPTLAIENKGMALTITSKHELASGGAASTEIEKDHKYFTRSLSAQKKS
jgi:hypothetical protein